MDLDRRAAAFGTFVEAHYQRARWAGIVLGALILLLWPSPTLSTLILIGALVALYIGALEWLRSKAPAAQVEEAVEEELAAAVKRAVDQPALAVPAPRHNSEPLVPAGLTSEAISTLGGRLDLLVRLGAAREAGVLTDDEFRHEKERLLGV
jgi:hypothetical protein